ncbi:ABC transporter substrate-binding protein [Ferrovibrio sp.]|uniref:ABC transporter substrate-binding protein n=1 Tax=Ferrovibrio sp. TaxID=1917215 RepID=UPI001B4BBBF3|nr:ABC transporter substrate-binding protein [Ferrovibrio sp.]MBP7064527.1 ABC transporter substrate-binding protein [Ferrovibrio sp.]
MAGSSNSSWRRIVAATAILLGGAAPAWAADPGVYADRIVFGQAAVLEGPASALGTGMRDGILAAFAEANAAGGVKGRKLELVLRDDGYEPAKAAAAARQLLDQDKVFALIGPVGTPTSAAMEPIVAAAQVPFIGPFTGAEFLRNPYKPHVVNVRASYFQETEEMVERLTVDLKHERIAILYQNDSFGRAGLAGVQRALTKRKMELAGEATFERNTTAVKRALIELRKREPQAIIIIGPYAPAGEFIRAAKKLGLKTVFVNISFVGSDALAGDLGPDGAGVVVTQVVPFPRDTSIPLVAAYQKALAAYMPKAWPGFISLEGYMVGRLAIQALQKLEGEPSRAALLKALGSGNYDLGGVTLGFGPDDNQGSDAVFLTRIDAEGRFQSIRSLQ